MTIDLNAIQPFHPPRRALMGPGPSDMHPRVLTALGQPVIGHLDPAFADMMEELKVLLRYAFQTDNALTFPVSGPGSVGMETCFVNLVEPGDKVIVCRNGVFGGRMIENVERCGGVAVVVEDAWGEAVDPQKLADALKAHPDAKVVAFVQAETSTGALSDARILIDVAHQAGCLTIVDAVTSLGGVALEVDEWGADAVYSGSQKCLSCTPGLSPVTFGERAVERVKNRQRKVQSWFMDLNLVLGYWDAAKRTYHHTAPINSLYALHESLLMLKEEGIENAWARHQRHHLALRAGFEALGLSFVVKPEARLPQLNAVHVPDGIDEAAVRRSLLTDFNLEIGAGLGPLAGKIWRFGLMGHSCREENVLLCLDALARTFAAQGRAADGAGAIEAARAAYGRC
ncbi:pyridoxal-phosphate-dependent aminotransferase family protein [Denitratisoma sp. DHT3]|uniref:pyridoxal-phosphate-dependent aminotransferase family protein n=1 Tax=Denitratisoma sp. DHT3 TaxID=1981880 RepID=UPI001C981952|nr:alanine--glyoxylate aminotransferase family protein [Denitratisoma sp. DHT3]